MLDALKETVASEFSLKAAYVGTSAGSGGTGSGGTVDASHSAASQPDDAQTVATGQEATPSHGEGDASAHGHAGNGNSDTANGRSGSSQGQGASPPSRHHKGG